MRGGQVTCTSTRHSSECAEDQLCGSTDHIGEDPTEGMHRLPPDLYAIVVTARPLNPDGQPGRKQKGILTCHKKAQALARKKSVETRLSPGETVEVFRSTQEWEPLT